MFKPQLLQLSLLLAFINLLTIGCSQTNTRPEINRPKEVWVFRSVLDKNARMATAALDENLWLAYNTQSATLYKAWKGGVKFDGAVYTTKHGPQPTSLGYAYFSHQEQWVLLNDGKETIPKINYKGHRFEKNEVIFKFELETPKGKFITIEESPIYVVDKQKNGLERNFNISNNTDYKIGLKTFVTSLENENDFHTNGDFKEIKKETISFDKGKIIDIQGLLKLNSSETSFTTFYHPGFDENSNRKKDVKSKKGNEKKIPAGAKLIQGNDCVACHNEKVKTVGPAYIDIAEKYNDTQSTIDKLTAKIKKGGKGAWGEVPMTPHPNLSDKDVNKMVKYILDLDNKSEKSKGGYSKKYTLGQQSTSIKFNSKSKPSNGKGLVANLYLRDPASQEKVYSKKPVSNAVTKNIHVLKKGHFGKHKSNIKIIFKGEITIAKTNSYDFRLISDDGSMLYIDGKEVIDNGGSHGFVAVDGETYLKKGKHQVKIVFEQGGGDGAVSFQWFHKTNKKFEVVSDDVLSHKTKHFTKAVPFIAKQSKTTKRPGDQMSLNGVHPSFTLYQARPDSFEPKVGGMDFKSDNTIVLSTWDADGSVYLIKNYTATNPEDIEVKKIATGLAEPLGVKIVNDEIYVLQKQELTKLIDHDGDEIIDEYQTVSNNWKVSANFHEFAFGLAFKEGHFYATLATAILPGGASANPQIEDRGKVLKIDIKDGSTQFEAFGLRTPNGIGMNVDNELFVADNQGDWLPASKIVHIQKGKFYGSHSVDPVGTKDLEEKLPVVWLPQGEIGNSPSTPTYLNIGPYKNQLIHGEVTHGGIKRVAYEEVEGQLQGAVFRFTQGIEAGVNRICWAPDGSLLIGGIGVSGNWGHYGKLKHGLQRMKYNGTSAFEMLKINALNNGFEIEFTEPIAANIRLSAKDIEIKQWYYKPTKNYGGPKLELETLKISKLVLSKDRKKATLRINDLKENHVVYFHLNNQLKSSTDKKLWTTEAWYTLNRIPK